MSDDSSLDSSPSKKRKTYDAFLEYKRRYELTCKWRGLVDAKLHGASPYNFFLTRIEDSRDTFDEDLSITFPELLDKSLGTIEHSLHVNFMVDLPWLLAQYAVNDIFNPSMTIVYGVEDTGVEDLAQGPSPLKVKCVHVKPPNAFGHHHTKMSIFYYTDKSLRFAVYTANLIESDWENRTQGIWISPKCPYLGDDVPINYGESETFFKVDILKYLNSYHLPELRDWLTRIQKADCSSIRVCFVGSIPGDHNNDSFGHTKLRKLLKENSVDCDSSSWNFVVQCSSIGSLGPTPGAWFLGEFGLSLQGGDRRDDPYDAFLIYPSVKNVSQSHDGMLGGACLPYSSHTHLKQRWLQSYVCQWKSNSRYRTRAVPHIKTYAKISSDRNSIAWFLLTSANLSKAAWGRLLKDNSLKILSYEAGVLFLPKFLIGKNSFTIKRGGASNPNDEGFPLPFDWPLTSYRHSDKMFLYDKCFSR